MGELAAQLGHCPAVRSDAECLRLYRCRTKSLFTTMRSLRMPTLLEHPANPDGRGAEAAEAPSIWRTPLFQSLLAADTVTHFVFDQRTVGQIGRNPTCILGCSTPSLRATLSSFGRAGQCNHPGGHPPLGEGGSRTFSRRLPRPTRHACVMRWRKCSSSLGRQRGSHLKRLVRHCPQMFSFFFAGGDVLPA